MPKKATATAAANKPATNKATPILKPATPVAVEYDTKGGRTTKDFADAYAARRFYAAKHKAKKNPKVVKGTLPADAKAADAAKPTTNAKPPTSANETPRAAAVATTPGVDGFGLRVGSKAAAFAAGLTTTPQTMRELMDRAGLTKTKYNLLKKLVAQGKVLRTKEGKYALPPK